MINSGRLIENLKENFYRMDKMVLLCTYLLVTISTIFVYSATRDPKFVIQNLVWIAVGTFLIILLSLFDYRQLDFKPHIKKNVRCVCCNTIVSKIRWEKDIRSSKMAKNRTIPIATVRICKNSDCYYNCLVDCK